MLDFLRIKFHAIGLIMKNREKAAARGILGAYIRLIFTYVFAVKTLGFKKKSENILGLKIVFSSYKVFVGLFEEIFIYNTYYFRAPRSNPFILDCGSNIGLSVLYFKKLYPQARVTAFEADRDAFAMLEKNVSANGLKDITLVNRALYEKKGVTLEFFSIASDSGNPVNSLVKRPDEFKFKEPVKVLTDTLSGYMDAEVDFLKMDIEGAENGVLNEVQSEGRIKLIKECVLEYHHHLDVNEDKLGEILGMFEKNGFGYQISTWMKPPFAGRKFQDLNIYFYKK